ncbi:SDR family NAD(P)-dependent oxidoreductase [Herbidospora mongoliensis]|uniref:SDR family NAD(P)-dependent oxidoreductase n=1 Tax=Herbidospora mongoliensis TaxID=688067 RepID=UPI00082A001D|nr:SDR family NAD(P)-dependent oxidoreductase [Herbidospora mongoliensis]
MTTTAMITGASSGIGLEFARQLGARGHHLVLVSNEADRLEMVCAELAETYGVKAEAVFADLSVRADVARVAERAGAVDILVNNAGFGLRKWFLGNERAVEEALLDVMCRAVLVLSHAAGRGMRDRGEGAIVNVASIAGWVAGGTYSAAKSWIIAFSEGLATELAPAGVTVTVLCPGFVRTEFHRRSQISVDKLPDALWLDAGRVVRDCLADVDRGRVISVPGPVYKVIAWFARCVPRRYVRSGGKITRHRPPLR